MVPEPYPEVGAAGKQNRHKSALPITANKNRGPIARPANALVSVPVRLWAGASNLEFDHQPTARAV